MAVLAGGPGDDGLRGDEFGGADPFGDDPSRLLGLPLAGADALDGGAGDDYLTGGRERDVPRGGPGRDVIDAADGTRDVIRCGSGRDVAYVHRRDRPRGRERVRKLQRGR